ncbi:hypothetical protein C8R42DRAFT_713847 [Lentinula raphanica]|nr:hypothetical protein C8R42DRAFT_713847 [Lentinula raphanica]
MSSSSEHPTPRDYVDADFPRNWKKADYVALVQHQLPNWPNTEPPFSPSKTSIADIKRVLKDPSTRFKTSTPLPTAQTLIPGYGVGMNSSKVAKSASTQAASSKDRNTMVETQTQDQASNTAIQNIQWSQRFKNKRSEEISYVSQEITVPRIDSVGCKPNEFRARSEDILNALQQTPACLEDAGQLLKSDPQHPGFNQILVKSGAFSSAIPSPEFLVVPESRVITFIVEKERSKIAHGTGSTTRNQPLPLLDVNVHASTSVEQTNKPPQQLINLDLDWSKHGDDITPLEFARRTKPQRQEQKTKSKGARKERMTTWLRGEAEKLPGFKEFQESRCHRLSNPDIVEHWAFAANLSETKFRTKCEVTGLTITKKVIAKVLGLGETSLATAEEGHNLIALYGMGGSHEAQEVIDAVEGNNADVTGATELLEFLRDWEVEHPVPGSKAEKRRERRQRG